MQDAKERHGPETRGPNAKILHVDPTAAASVANLNPSINFSAEDHQVLASIEASSFWFRARNHLIVDLVRQYCGGFQTLIEVGCGTGFVLQGLRAAFPSARLTGVEPLATGLAEARKRVGGEVELICGDIASFPYGKEFDVVGAFDVLEHVDDDRAAIGDLTRLARLGGVILLTVPQHPWLWSDADEIARHCRRYRRGELEAKVMEAGLEVLMTTSFVCSLMPAMLLNRFLGIVRPKDEHVLPRPINAILDRILDGERRLIKRRIRFPVGGTRVVVARRVRN